MGWWGKPTERLIGAYNMETLSFEEYKTRYINYLVGKGFDEEWAIQDFEVNIKSGNIYEYTYPELDAEESFSYY